MRMSAHTKEGFIAYLTDCTLATVQDLAMKKSRSESEFKRQILIAQKSINFMDKNNIDYSGTRAENITTSVDEWARKYDVKANK